MARSARDLDLRQHHDVETPEHVAVHFELAGVGSRMAAGLLDLLFLFLGDLLILIGWGALGGFSSGRGADVQGWLTAVMILLLFSFLWGYFTLFEALNGGRTPGKQALGIRVVMDTGRTLTPSASVVRNLVRFAPDVAYRALMQRVPRSDRMVLIRAEVRANLRAALKEGLRPGIDGARQDLRLFCAPWGLLLQQIDVPTVLWQGSDDTLVPPGAAYHLAETLPNCRLDVLQGGGHYWVFGEFERVLDVIQAALRS